MPYLTIPLYLVLVLLLIVPLIVLTVLWALALKHLPPERRRGLLPVGCVMFAVAALLFGGEWILERFGLTWRYVPVWTLSLLLWCLGWAAGVLTIFGTYRRTERHRDALTGVTIFCFIAAMGVGTIAGGVWFLSVAPSREAVGEYQGQLVVQDGNAWDSGYRIYAYHGPLVRGKEPLAWKEVPFFEKLSLWGIDKTLGLDLSAGTVVDSRDTHGGMGNDGETFVVVRFEDDGLEEQLAGWEPLPLPPGAEQLRQLAEDHAFPIPPATEGLYWVRDDQNRADPSDGSHIFDGDRGSYNCALAVYSRAARTLYYYELDT